MEEFNDGVKAGPSCAEHDEVAANAGIEQTISANVISASIAIGYISDIVKNIFGDEKNPFHNEIGFTINGSKISYSYK
jgi:hypothetical protein